jgi:hypothetical protein
LPKPREQNGSVAWPNDLRNNFCTRIRERIYESVSMGKKDRLQKSGGSDSVVLTGKSKNKEKSVENSRARENEDVPASEKRKRKGAKAVQIVEQEEDVAHENGEANGVNVEEVEADGEGGGNVEADGDEGEEEVAVTKTKVAGKKRGTDKIEQDGQAEEKKKSKKTKFEIEKLDVGTTIVSGIMSGTAFETLPVSEPTKNAIKDTGFTHMTEVKLMANIHILLNTLYMAERRLPATQVLIEILLVIFHCGFSPRTVDV